ncbi:MAG TPA: hypothetical protein VK452_06955 [Dissulfurispiraceae bacterium]|nr:hypothetical protein [Dissulfurispiraceae bacterium]
MKRLFIALFIIALVFIYAFPTCAAMHKWVDEKGRVWITDYPAPKKIKEQPGGNAQEQLKTEDAISSQPGGDRTRQNDSIPGLASLPEDVRKKINDIFKGDGSSIMSSSSLALAAGFMLVFAIAFYIYICLCLFLIARKLGIADAWTAWVPVVNVWTFVESAGRPWWWIVIIALLCILSVLPVVGIILSIANAAIIIYLWMCISENMGKNRWMGLLMLVPIVNLFYPAILAFSRPETDVDNGNSTTSISPGRY